MEEAKKWVRKLTVKNGTYPPDSYPNPGKTEVVKSRLIVSTYAFGFIAALAYHNAQLEAAAFREEYDPDTFVDLTEPNTKAIHRVSKYTPSK